MDTTAFIAFMYSRVPPGLPADVTVWDAKTKKADHITFSDARAILVAAAQRELQGIDSYYGVALTRPGLDPGRKGGKRDVLVLPSFWLDVDIKGPGHAAENLPTEEEAYDILASCSLEPTLIVESGGGLHAYWCVEDPWNVAAAGFETINSQLKAFQDLFIAYAATKKLHVDQTGNIDRVLRLPGTSNFKTGTARQVRVVFEGSRCKNSDLLALIPFVLPSLATIAAAATATQTSQTPPQSSEVFLHDLRRRMRNVSNLTNRKLMQKILAGESFAKQGERDAALQKVVSVIAFAAPDNADPAQTAEILHSSLDTMAAESNDPANPALTMADAIEKMTRALQDATAVRASKKAENASWMPWLARAAAGVFKRPKIGIGTDAEPVVDAMIEALADLGKYDPKRAVYVNSGRLADIATDDVSTTEGGIKRPPNAPWIRTLPLKGLMERLSSAAEFGMARKDKDGLEVFTACLPPLNFAEFLEARSSWPRLPHLEGIVESPVLLPGGKVLEKPGYDPVSGILFSPNKPYPAVPVAPTAVEAQAAMDELLDWSQDFSFKADHDKSALASLILTCVSRYAIDGPVPAFTFSAPTPGSGKSKLLSGAVQVALGRPATTTSLINDESEMDKRLLSIGLSGVPVVVFDDLPDGMMGTSALSRVLTDYSGKMTGRLLGQSKMVTATIKTIFIASGNNISYANTLARRVVECTIDPGVENPQLRSGWKYPNLTGHIGSIRERLVICALTVLRAHYLAGSPQHGLEPIGSFEKWDSVVRSAIIWTGYADPCAGRAQMRIASDSDTEPLRMLVAAWNTLFGSRQLSIAYALETALHKGIGGADLVHAMSMIDERHRPAQLGKMFGRWRDRVVDGYKLECAVNTKNKASEWRIVQVNNVIPIATAVPAVEVAAAQGEV